MKLPSWIRRFIPTQTRPAAPRPLREFVYLDEVSLRSLLSSQRDGLAEANSRQQAENWSMEDGTLVQLGTDLTGKVQGTSRFQTSNSSTLQTSRKATVQSWFRELHEIPGLRTIEVVSEVTPIHKATDLKSANEPSRSVRSSRLKRGDLIEMRVRLSADPIFRLVTMIAEFTGMAQDFPEGMVNELSGIAEATMANRIFDRLLAGLIPIRAEAVDHVVVDIDGEQYVVHRGALAGSDLQSQPLTVVGVTEHLAYWKDIRRVLFSEAEFTIMGRLARGGLQTSWTPVKLVDVFSTMVPDLAKQMQAAGRFMLTGPREQGEHQEPNLLEEALWHYKSLIEAEKGKRLTPELGAIIEAEIAAHAASSASPQAQRDAFNAVRLVVQKHLRVRIGPEKDLQLRERARTMSGLPLLPGPTKRTQIRQAEASHGDAEGGPMLDLEVVAIYW